MDNGRWSDEQFIRFAMEADRRMAIVEYTGNPEQVEEWGYSPVNIHSREDVERILAPYWVKKTRDELWQQGNRLVPEFPFGFYSEGNFHLIQAKDIHIQKKTADRVVIAGQVGTFPDAGSYVADISPIEVIVELVKTPDGWRAGEWKFY